MFIVFEGIDGSGKSTVIREVSKLLKSRIYITREPSNGKIGKLIRKILKRNKSIDRDFSLMITNLFCADRFYHIKNEIKPALDVYKYVICDRYYYSTLAYQSVYLDLDYLITLNKYALKPDITFIIDVDVNTALNRIKKRKTKRTTYEYKEYLEKVRRNYLKLPKLLDDNIYIVKNYDLEKCISEILKIIHRVEEQKS